MFFLFHHFARFPRGEIYDLLTTKPEDAANGKQAE